MELLERWGVGLTQGAAERRMALRLSHQRLRLVGGDPDAADPATVAALPTVARLTAISGPATDATATAGVGAEDAWPDRDALPSLDTGDTGDLGGDDDEDDEFDAAPPAQIPSALELSDEQFYADVMDSA